MQTIAIRMLGYAILKARKRSNEFTILKQEEKLSRESIKEINFLSSETTATRTSKSFD